MKVKEYLPSSLEKSEIHKHKGYCLGALKYFSLCRAHLHNLFHLVVSRTVWKCAVDSQAESLCLTRKKILRSGLPSASESKSGAET